ncbi:golvesin C-terminal-like domain-containing protein [Mucisphaera calidilacus]|uniref:AmiA-like protein n=1 Tax=Mucisphaera calidilacus TaxID=2527982 RepID=A0A518BTT1_9BACT|nr:hypothetical protein [Mucisphaera calidilacus]QDU70369.1 AmiA-like protein [Mucisphaera calidilacus]
MSQTHAPSSDNTVRFESLEDRVLLSAVTENPTGFTVSLGEGQSILLDFDEDGPVAYDVQADLMEVFAQSSASTSSLPVPVGTQPEGALSGKIVYVHAGHGYTWTNNSFWTTQRGEGFEIVEDMGNMDQMNFLIDQLWNAGATVVPLRPAQHQINEVVLDNVDAEVTFVGSWNNSSSSIYYGESGETPYRWASTSGTETAYARYTPDIPEAGYYPVYTFARHGSDRVEQLYKVHHTGGITEVTVDHSKVGSGWVYLGNFYFDEGTDGYVDISNRSDQSGVVIADAIRFGNGMGDSLRNGSPSGYAREDEAGLYWMEALVRESQGISTSEYRSSSDDRSATVSASPRWAEYMNREAGGSFSDRVFLSYHSNAGGGRGAVGLHNTSSGGNTPNQFEWAELTGAHLNDDMQAIGSPPLEHLWSNRSTNTYQASFNYGEIHNAYIGGEFDATILEVAFHDSQFDSELMRDPVMRQWAARASVHAMIEYFDNRNNVASTVEAPEAVTGVSAMTNAQGDVTLSWDKPAFGGVNGDAATGYLIQTSFDGYGFDGGTYVAGGNTLTHTFDDLDGANGVHYFRVLAVNNGGVSLDSETVAANPGQAGDPSILIVNGFDRFDRTLNPQITYSVGTIDRVRPQWMNSFDYTVQHADAIHAYDPSIGFNSVQNEDVINGTVDLNLYTTVVWILGEESTADATFDATEQALVSSFVGSGGNLFVSGSEIAYDLDGVNNGQSFFNNTLGATYVSDDSDSNTAAGVSGSIFAGISLNFDDGDVVYDVDSPDVISATNGSLAAMTYGGSSGGGGRPGGGGGGVAAIQLEASGGQGGVVMLAFPFESIVSQDDRHDVMAAALGFLGADPIERPDAPTDLDVAIYTNQAVVSWTQPDDPTAVGVHVERAVADGLFERITTEPLTDPVFLDTGLLEGIAVAYRVVSVDAEGVTSLPLEVVEGTPPTATSVVADIDTPLYQLDGTWSSFVGLGYEGSFAHAGTVGAPSTATWNLDLEQAGHYEVSVFIPEALMMVPLGHGSYTLTTTSGTAAASVDQAQSPTGGWLSLGSFDLAAGEFELILDAAASTDGSFVVADAIRVATVTVDQFQDPAEVVEVVVGSETWTQAFLDQIDTGRGLGYGMPGGAGQLASLPWSSLNTISLVFSEAVYVTQDDFDFTWNDGAAEEAVVFVYDAAAHTATWVFDSNAYTPAGVVTVQQVGTVLDHQGVEADTDWVNGVSEASGNGIAGGMMNYLFSVVAGSADGDTMIDANDIDAVLRATQGNGATAFTDLDGSGTTDADDANLLVIDILGTQFGDANLDQSVDLLDLSALASSFDATDGDWASGDFNGDGNVDLLDLSLLASNFGYTAPVPAPALAQATVAEPQIASKTQQTQQDQSRVWSQSRQHAQQQPLTTRAGDLVVDAEEDEAVFGLWES